MQMTKELTVFKFNLLSNTDTGNNGVASNTGTAIIDTPTETGIRPQAYTAEPVLPPF